MPVDIVANDHVAIRVADLQRSADWYAATFGFEVLLKWANAWMLQKGDLRLGIYFSTAHKTVDTPDDYLVMHHFAFRVTAETMLDAEVYFKGNGIEYEGPKDPGGFWSIMVKDPDGYRVELICFHPSSAGAGTG